MMYAPGRVSPESCKCDEGGAPKEGQPVVAAP